MKLNLKSYLGKWYEIASVPAWFQKNCQNTTAEYSMRDDGNIQVKNTCDVVKNDQYKKTKEIVGKAFISDEPNTLKVQFFPLIKAPYKIEHVDNAYSTAIVSSGDYLWLLSRQKSISNQKYNEMIKIAASKELNVDELIKTKQGKSFK